MSAAVDTEQLLMYDAPSISGLRHPGFLTFTLAFQSINRPKGPLRAPVTTSGFGQQALQLLQYMITGHRL